ncbi:MAG: ABC transporter substrate-binding protein, partial [Chlamydiota bacterium]
DPSLPEVVGPYVFLTPFGDNAQAAAAAEFAFEKFGSKVAIVADSTSEYTRMLPKYFRKSFENLGGQVLFDETFDGGCDLRSIAERIKGLKEQPSFIYLAGLPNCIGKTIASIRKSDIPLPILGGDGFDTPNLMKSGKEPTTNVWFTTHAWLSNDSENKKAKEFRADYERAYGKPPSNAFSALGYDAANLLLEVFKRSPKIDSKSVKKTLEEIRDFQGVTGTISYSADHHVPVKTVWIIQVKDGKESLATSMIPKNVSEPLIPSVPKR